VKQKRKRNDDDDNPLPPKRPRGCLSDGLSCELSSECCSDYCFQGQCVDNGGHEVNPFANSLLPFLYDRCAGCSCYQGVISCSSTVTANCECRLGNDRPMLMFDCGQCECYDVPNPVPNCQNASPVLQWEMLAMMHSALCYCGGFPFAFRKPCFL